MARPHTISSEPFTPDTLDIASKADIRLQCLQLAYRHDRKEEDILLRADILARYVIEGKR
jgi:hypothetical protein